MSRRMTLIISSLGRGGSERVMAMLANHWHATGHEVTLVTLDSEQSDVYQIHPGIQRVALGLMQESRGLLSAIRNNFKRIRRLRWAIRDSHPEVVISFIDQMNVLTLLACSGLNIDVVISERINPTRHDIGRIWSMMRRLTYPRCKTLVVQSERIRKHIGTAFGARSIAVIPNAVEKMEPFPAERESAEKRILAMGRLVPQKGFDLLIESFSRLAEKFPDWSLTILGEGPERRKLEELIQQKHLADRILLSGWLNNPQDTLKQSDLFVLSSRFEGFPNALLEAMACGLPVISFDCDSGPADIIRDGVDGILVPAENVESLTAAIERLLSDSEQRKQLSLRAAEVTNRFSTARLFERWEQVISTE